MACSHIVWMMQYKCTVWILCIISVDMQCEKCGGGAFFS